MFRKDEILMKELHFDQLSVLCREPVPGVDLSAYSAQKAADTLRFHRSLPVYAETPLVSLSSLSAQAKIRAIFVKDESFASSSDISIPFSVVV